MMSFDLSFVEIIESNSTNLCIHIFFTNCRTLHHPKIKANNSFSSTTCPQKTLQMRKPTTNIIPVTILLHITQVSDHFYY